MADSGLPVDRQADWDNLSLSPPDLNDFSLLPSLSNDFPDLPPDTFFLSVDEIEQLLMKDGDGGDAANQEIEIPDGFLSDILLDSPDGSGEVFDVSDHCKTSSPSENYEEEQEDGKTAEEDLKENNQTTDAADPHDPLSKKRKRQLRNRDAAVKSRERKKMYVKNLEMKSRYYEGECKRLGMVLQCCLAENHALRLSLQNGMAFDASMTKQESAVLLLESLLLGSLLWFLGIVCLLILPSPPQPSREVVHDKRGQSPTKLGSSIYGPLLFQSFLVSKRCKASRSRMKRGFHSLQVFG